MKTPRLLTILVALLCVIAVSGQTKVARSTAKVAPCRVNGVAFKCPTGFVVKNQWQKGKALAAFNARTKVGIFAFGPDTGTDAELMDKALGSALNSLYSTEFGDYVWKNSLDFYGDDKWSTFETAKVAKAGLNRGARQVIHLQMVRLKIKGSDYVAGFVYEFESRETAEVQFREWNGGGNGDASTALQALIAGITGEKKKDYNDLPGGPPPRSVN